MKQHRVSKKRLIIIASLITITVLGVVALVKKVKYDSIDCEAIRQEHKEFKRQNVIVDYEPEPEVVKKCFR